MTALEIRDAHPALKDLNVNAYLPIIKEVSCVGKVTCADGKQRIGWSWTEKSSDVISISASSQIDLASTTSIWVREDLEKIKIHIEMVVNQRINEVLANISRLSEKIDKKETDKAA